MSKPSVFGSEWRDCLREHYKQIVRTGDVRRRAETADALRQAGFSDAELSGLYVAATMHVDAVPDDFIPDLETLEARRQQREMQPHPNECVCPSCVPEIAASKEDNHHG